MKYKPFRQIFHLQFSSLICVNEYAVVGNILQNLEVGDRKKKGKFFGQICKL